MDARAKILDKIKKCMALSTSGNEHEAEAALRQARKLMEMHGVTELDVQASQAEEQRAKAGAKTKPANWESALAGKVADAFACHLIFVNGWRSSEWSFIGCGAAPEVASYTFSVLLRQAKRARDEYIKNRLKRCKTSTKTRRADLFSEGWVRSVVRAINAFAGTEEQTTAINTFMANNYPSLMPLKTSDRNSGRKLQDREMDDFLAGSLSGRDASLNRGVGGDTRPLAIGAPS